MEVSTRLALDKDMEFVWSLYCTSVKPTISKLIAWRDTEQKARFWETNDLSKINIAVVEDEPIGWFMLSESETTLDLEQLFILEQYRRKGLGRGIATWARAQADEKALGFRLPTLDEPSALAFARSLRLAQIRHDETTIIFS